MNEIYKFELIAELFYNKTGYVRPGKDISPIMVDDLYIQRRNDAWEKFVEGENLINCLVEYCEEMEELTYGPTWVCDSCGKVGKTGFVTVQYESMDGIDYDIKCTNCGSTEIEEDGAYNLVHRIDELEEKLDSYKYMQKELEK